MIIGMSENNDLFGFLGIAIGSLSGIAVAFINSRKNKKKKDCSSLIIDLKDHDIFNTLKRTQYEVGNSTPIKNLIGLRLPCVTILQNTK